MYPDSPPVPAAEFDWTRRDHFAAVYGGWALSFERMSRWLDANGIEVSASTLRYWGRHKHKLPLAQEHYRKRAGGEDIDLGGGGGSEGADALLEYLRGRHVPVGVPPKEPPAGRSRSVALIGCDLHFPFHHEGAFELFLALCDRWTPDEVILNGDTWDFQQLSRFVKDPATITPIQGDIDLCREAVLARVNSAAPKANRRLILGNHEKGRWDQYLFTKCPELASLRCLTLEAILGLAEMGWIFDPDGLWLTPDLLVFHGDRHTSSLGGGSAQSARKEQMDIGASTITGHTHKGGMFYRRDARGYRVSAEGFSLCDDEKMAAAGVTQNRYRVKALDWQKGCLRVDFNPGGEGFVITPVPFLTKSGKTWTIVEGEEVAV